MLTAWRGQILFHLGRNTKVEQVLDLAVEISQGPYNLYNSLLLRAMFRSGWKMHKESIEDAERVRGLSAQEMTARHRC